MTTLTVKVPYEARAKLSAFVKELGGEVITPSSKGKMLNEIKKGLREVKEIQEGKLPAYTVSDLFDE